jgi:hypothetical protein
MDMFEKSFGECVDKSGFLDTLASISKLVSGDTVNGLGQSLVAAHKPHVCDFAAHFEIAPLTDQASTTEHVTLLAAETCCDKCRAVIDAQVVKYCRTNHKRFQGRILCRACQTTAAVAKCADCGAAVDQKVVAFCRFNSKRLSKKVLCRSCQSKITAAQPATV